jgi:hypothetical protein
MQSTTSRVGVVALVAASMALLLPGIFLPVLTIRGVITPEGIAQMTPVVLEKGLDDKTVETLKGMMNPTVVALVQATGGDLRTMIIRQLGPRLAEALRPVWASSRSTARRAASSAPCGTSTTSAAGSPRR